MEMHFNPPVKSGFHKMNRKKASFEHFSASSQLPTTIEEFFEYIYSASKLLFETNFFKNGLYVSSTQAVAEGTNTNRSMIHLQISSFR